MEAKTCPQCGAIVNVDYSREYCFCSYCGTKIQLNRTIIHKHTGEICFEGVATANSIAQKGFMDLARKDYNKARETFEKAQEIEPTNTLVLFGLACASLDLSGFFINQLVAKHNDISEQEKIVINNTNALYFAKIYLFYDLPARFEYVVKGYHIDINLDLLHHEQNNYNVYNIGIMKPNRKIDIVDLLLNNNVNVDDLSIKLIESALSGIYNGYPNLSISQEIFSPNTFEKLINSGLNIRCQFNCKASKADKDGWPESYISHQYIDLFFRHKSPYSEILNKYHPLPKTKGCYIATCVYGSYNCPQVWTLRRYRDITLAKTWFGRTFIKIYYAISPTIVEWFGNADWFKKMWKLKLDRIVANLNYNGVDNTPYDDKDW